MPKDISNIFKLSTKEQKEYNGNPFFDCMPGAQDYANCLMQSIKTKPTPYVLMLDSKFGMGKTYFSTRFTKFLRKNDINCVYFSAWENDYIESPFASFSKEILLYINKEAKRLTKAKNKIEEVSTTTLKLILDMAKSTSTTFGINAGLFNGQININNEKLLNAAKDFMETFISEKDSIIKFKETLKSFIENDLPNKRLVLIVDELDRCRPDYAMKTLEIIKHFFDIKGLFIILPTNENSMNKCVQSLYGFNEDKKSSECYFKKFFDDTECLYEPDYLKIIQDNVTSERLQKAFDEHKFSTENGRYNSLDTLHTKLNEYCKCERFTMRETVAICEKIVHFCNHINKKLDCEYLAYKICQKHSRNDRPQLALSMDHPFVINGTKQNLLTWKVPEEVYKIGHAIYRHRYEENYPDFVDRRCSSYSDFYNFYTHLKNAIQEGFRPTLRTDYRGYYGTSQSFACNSNIIDNALNQMFNEIKAYQAKWNSDEKDDELKAYYDSIIEREYKLHDCLKVEE